jgi:CheY-like chemotaxis protein
MKTNLIAGKSILLVDDEIDLLEIIEEDLVSHGCVVAKATNGLDALKLAKAQVFDFILSDIRMPGLDGTELLNKLKAESENKTKFIFLSGQSNFSEEELKKMGASAIVNKPFDFDHLISTLIKFS